MSVRCAAILLVLFGATAMADERPDVMIELMLKGKKIEGSPLQWNDTTVNLLGRDGTLWQFSPSQAANFRKTADHFRAYSVSELRATLLKELGAGFEVTGTSSFLVAHRQGQRDKWAERFEQLYRSFVHYFSVRGFKLSKPPYPLLAIVCRSRDEFHRYAEEQGGAVPQGVVGFYSPESNRIVLYDTGGSETSKRWQENAAILIHEATHQSAFNSGIHSRYTQPPLWIAEGLATMFEAPGVYDSHGYPSQNDRINRGRFEDFRRAVAPRHQAKLLASLVASDQLFRANPGAAYAEAWAFTFFLVETQPAQFAKYLARTVARPPFQEYTAAQRTADFVAVFGDNWPMLEARFLRFVAALK